MHTHITHRTIHVALIALALCAAVGTAHAQSGAATITLSAEVQDRIVGLSERVTSRAQIVVTRFENIIVRLDSRIAKLTAEGVDTSVAETRLADAKRALAQAQSALTAAPSARAAITAGNPREAFVGVRTGMRGAYSYLAEAHISLLDTINLLKEAVAQHNAAPATE